MFSASLCGADLLFMHKSLSLFTVTGLQNGRAEALDLEDVARSAAASAELSPARFLTGKSSFVYTNVCFNSVIMQPYSRFFFLNPQVRPR